MIDYYNNHHVGRLALCLMLGLILQGFYVSAQQPNSDGVPEGYMLIEGDIIVKEDFYETQGKQAWRDNMWWTGGVVPYEFDDNVTPQWRRDSMLLAMGVWEAVSGVDFVPYTNQPNYVHIQAAMENNSMVGMQGGMQVINIYNWSYRLIMAHELMHCLGFWHEQSRPARDQFITIITDSILFGQGHNFDIHGDAGEWGYYDFTSIMHYGQCAFSVCECNANPPSCCCDTTGQGRTIVVKPEYSQYQSLIGNRDSVSHLDIMSMKFAYPPDPWWKFCSKDADGLFPDGSFPNPYHNFSDGVAGTQPGGVLWILAPGVYSAPGLHKKPIILKAPLGGVVLSN